MNLTLILLAAGDSRRFHGNKLLYQIEGKPMYRYIMDEIEKLPQMLFYKKLIVTQYEEIIKSLNGCPYKIIKNQNSSLGISHSIQLALKELESEETDFLFAVCDQPYLKSSTIHALVNGYHDSKKGLACLGSRGELGNPAIFSYRYREELKNLNGDTGGKRIIKKHMSDLFLLEVEDSNELKDIDIRIN